MQEREKVFAPTQIRNARGEVLEGFLPDQAQYMAQTNWLALGKEEKCRHCRTLYAMGMKDIPIISSYYEQTRIFIPILICSCK